MQTINRPTRLAPHRDHAVRRISRGGLLLLAALSGCAAVGPDYQPPEVAAPDHWRQELCERLAEGPAALEHWWTTFQDPVLDGLIEHAERNNRDLRVSLARIAAARAARDVAHGDFYPDTQAFGGYTRFRNSEHAPGAPPPPPLGPGVSNLNDTTFGVDADWELDVFGRIRRSVEAADADFGASIEDYHDLMVILFGDVATAYVDLRSFEERLAIAQANAELQRATLDLVQNRFDTGLAPELDVSQARQNLATTEAAIPSLQEGLRFAWNRLAVLVGEDPGALAEQVPPGGTSPPAPDVAIAVGLPADLVRRRPDLRAAERRVAAAVARIGVATADLYPRFSLSGSYGYDAEDGSKVLDSESRTFSIGPSVRWNLFNGGRVRAAIRVQDALAEQAVANYERVVLLAFEDVEDALSGLSFAGQRREKLDAALVAARRSVELVRGLYIEGLTDFQNVLDAERSLLSLEDQRAVAAADSSRFAISLYRALGGGIEPADGATQPANP